jgi:hypothetical protein
MATQSKRPTASAAEAPADGTTPETTLTPTITHYQQLADAFMKDLDEIATTIPKLEASHVSTANFVRSHLNVSNDFLATAIAAVEQTPALQGVNKLDVLAARDTLQFIEAFRPVLDKVSAFASSLKFTIASRNASLAADALQIYDIAKGVARDPGSAAVASLVANMKRDLGRRGPAKGTIAARKAAAALSPAATPAPATGGVSS